MSITEKELQTFITKIGAKIQSMADVSYNKALMLGEYTAKLAEFPDSQKLINTLTEYNIKRDLETEHYEQLKELANMYNEFFVK